MELKLDMIFSFDTLTYDRKPMQKLVSQLKIVEVVEVFQYPSFQTGIKNWKFAVCKIN